MRVLCALLVGVIGCVPGDLAHGRFACGNDADCAEGWACVEGFCCAAGSRCADEPADAGSGPADAGCEPESDSTFCGRLGKSCGPLTSNDNCGHPRTVASCGACRGTCTDGICSTCTPETDPTFCARLEKSCGSVSGNDNCGKPRTVASCGACTSPQSCVANACQCVAETDAQFCARLGLSCGSATGTDNCGHPRSIAACGSACPGGSSCVSGTCRTCTPVCSGRQCGPDNCGGSCGACTSPPPADCADATTRRTYGAGGTCSTAGLCQYAPTTAACTTTIANADATCTTGTCGYACRAGFVASGSTCVAAGLQPGAPWPMYRGGPTHQGRLVAGTVHASMTTRWSSTFLGHSRGAAAIAADGTVYAPTDNGLDALDPTGQQIWHFAAGNIDATPAIGADGALYFGSDGVNDQNLYAVNPDGSERWRVAATSASYNSAAISPAGTIYFPTGATLYAVDTTGQVRWKKSVANPTAPAIAPDGTVYVGSTDGTLYALNPDLTRKWSRTGLQGVASPTIGADGTIYIGATDQHVYALNPGNGSEAWSYLTNSPVYYSPALGADGRIYIATDYDDTLYALSATGTLLWSLSLTNPYVSSPVIGADGTIFLTNEDRSGTQAAILYAVNPSGTVKYKKTLAGQTLAEPSLGPDGTVYVNSDQGFAAYTP